MVITRVGLKEARMKVNFRSRASAVSAPCLLAKIARPPRGYFRKIKSNPNQSTNHRPYIAIVVGEKIKP